MIKLWLYICTVTVIVLLTVTFNTAHAGWFVDGQCQPDVPSALYAFSSQFPMTSGGFTTSTQSPILDTTYNVIGANYYTTNLSTGTTSNYWVTSTITQCDPAFASAVIASQVAAVISPPDILFAFTWGFAVIMLFTSFSFVISRSSFVIKKL